MMNTKYGQNNLHTQEKILCATGTGRQVVEFSKENPSACIERLGARVIAVGDVLDLERFAKFPGANRAALEARMLELGQDAAERSERPESSRVLCAIQQWIFKNSTAWSLHPGPIHRMGPGIATRPVLTAAGVREASIYASMQDDRVSLTAEYYSEGRNACSTEGASFDAATVANDGLFSALMTKFIKSVESTIDATYARRLYLHKQQDPDFNVEPEVGPAP